MLKDLNFYRRRLGGLHGALNDRLRGDTVPLTLSIFAAPGRIAFAEVVQATCCRTVQH
jgi:hypothetical protein